MMLKGYGIGGLCLALVDDVWLWMATYRCALARLSLHLFTSLYNSSHAFTALSVYKTPLALSQYVRAQGEAHCTCKSLCAGGGIGHITSSHFTVLDNSS